MPFLRAFPTRHPLVRTGKRRSLCCCLTKMEHISYKSQLFCLFMLKVSEVSGFGAQTFICRFGMHNCGRKHMESLVRLGKLKSSVSLLTICLCVCRVSQKNLTKLWPGKRSMWFLPRIYIVTCYVFWKYHYAP